MSRDIVGTGGAGGGTGGAGAPGGGTGAFHLTEETLHDYLDGSLSAEARREAEGHLGKCARCRAEVAEFGGLLDELASLPVGIAPERDLLPAIEARIDAREHPGLGAALWAARVPLAAAALVLMAVSSLVTAALLGAGGGPEPVDGTLLDAPGSEAETRMSAAGAGYRAVEAQYASATRELARTLEARRDELSPATVRLVEENLRVIDEALAEARAALAADPRNPVLRQMVVATHERKLEFLRRAARVAGEEGDS